MKHIFKAIAISTLVGCTAYSTSTNRKQVPPVSAIITEPEEFESAPNRIDKNIHKASIEDFIMALPKFAYHEESESSFRRRVRTARKAYAENNGKGANFLFVGSDGCWPSKDFALDRNSQILTIRIYNWEPSLEGTISMHTMRRVSGGWMRGASTNFKNPNKTMELTIHSAAVSGESRHD